MNLCDIGVIRSLQKTFGISLKHDYGQNFLINRDIVADTAEYCSPDRTSAVLEIGPGIGALTKELAERYRSVVALEIDESLMPVLAFTLTDNHNVRVINADVMKADLHALLEDEFKAGPVSVCANLPYYITTPILMKLLESRLPFESVTVMVQLEVAERLCAAPGTSEYGAISVSVNYYGVPSLLFKVSSDNFLPQPKVDSAVVRIALHKEKPCVPMDEAFFFSVIRAAFGQRRKTLVNALSSGFPTVPKETLAAAINALGHRLDIRGERLSCAQFVALSDELQKRISD